MATTAQQVFDLCMGLIAEVNEQTGETDTTDTREYKVRTLLILNTLRGELFPYSDTYKVTEPGKRPIVGLIQNFEEEIGLDDYICQTVMPFGLAAQLLLDDNPTMAGFCEQRYEELRNGLQKGFPQDGSVSITDVYGWQDDGGTPIFPYNNMGRW